MEPAQQVMAAGTVAREQVPENERKRKAEEHVRPEDQPHDPKRAADLKEQFQAGAAGGIVRQQTVESTPKKFNIDTLKDEEETKLYECLAHEKEFLTSSPAVLKSIENYKTMPATIEGLKQYLAYVESSYTEEEKKICQFLVEQGAKVMKAKLALEENPLYFKDVPEEAVNLAVAYVLLEGKRVQPCCAELKKHLSCSLIELVDELRSKRPNASRMAVSAIKAKQVDIEIRAFFISDIVNDPNVDLRIKECTFKPESLAVLKEKVAMAEGAPKLVEIDAVYTFVSKSFVLDYQNNSKNMFAQFPSMKDSIEFAVKDALLNGKAHALTKKIATLAPGHLQAMIINASKSASIVQNISQQPPAAAATK